MIYLRYSSVPGYAPRRLLACQFLLLCFSLFLAGSHPCKAAETKPSPIDSWLAAQTNIQTWSAEFTQTRTLKALNQPLVSHGRLWFSAPNQFRWELGSPPQTIAVRQPDQMIIIYPLLKRAERYPLGEHQTGPWRDALALLEAGFPQSRNELESRFRIVSQTNFNDVIELAMEPKSASARRLMPEIKIGFSTGDYALRSTEMAFSDGSRMRNQFTKAKLNVKLDDDLFTPKLDETFKVVEPLKQK